MRILTTTIVLLMLVGCSGKGATPKAASSEQPEGTYAGALQKFDAIALDTSTPDRLLKSIWAMMDAGRSLACYTKPRLEEKLSDGTAVGNLDGRTQMLRRLDAVSVGTAKSALDAYQVDKGLEYCLKFKEEFDRQVSEIKMETESRAVAFVTVRNVTPIPEGADSSNDVQKWRAEGERFKFEFSKEQSGWKLEQVSKYEKYGEKWEPMFSMESTRPLYPWIVSDGLQSY